MVIIIHLEIPTVDGIKVQCCQAAATGKRLLSDESNAGRYGYRCQTAAIGKRPIFNGSNAVRNVYRSQTAATAKRTLSDGSNAGRYGYRSFCTRALYQSVLNVIIQHSVYR